MRVLNNQVIARSGPLTDCDGPKQVLDGKNKNADVAQFGQQWVIFNVVFVAHISIKKLASECVFTNEVQPVKVI